MRMMTVPPLPRAFKGTVYAPFSAVTAVKPLTLAVRASVAVTKAYSTVVSPLEVTVKSNFGSVSSAL